MNRLNCAGPAKLFLAICLCLNLGATCPQTPDTRVESPVLIPVSARGPVDTHHGSPAVAPVLFDQYFGGGLYPKDGTPQRFELDAPLQTLAHTSYFAFSARFWTPPNSALGLAWISAAGGETPLQVVEGPCSGGLRNQMQQNALRFTGVDGPAAFDDAGEAALDGNHPLQVASCPDAGDPFTVMVLLPERLAGTGGTLRATSRRQFAAGVSDPLELAMAPAPLSFAVVGDSVAWGQGVPEGSKWYSLVHDALARQLGRTIAPPVVMAHSGASLRLKASPPAPQGLPTPLSDVTIANAPCGGPSPGEVPQSAPIIACQIRKLSERICEFDVPARGPPTFTCPPRPQSGPRVAVSTARFDLRPRWDFVLMDGCINDIGAGDLVMGSPYVASGELVRDYARSHCDLSRSVPDLASFLPNATVALIGYHLVVSNETDANRSGCLPVPPLGPGVLGAVPVAMFLALQADTQAAAARMMTFRSFSDDVLSSSLHALPAGPGGVGKKLFVSLAPSWSPANATFGPSPLNWGLDCTVGNVPFSPVDPVAASRFADCAAAFASGSLTDAADEQTCRRASAFHPNVAGHAAMAAAVTAAISSGSDVAPPSANARCGSCSGALGGSCGAGLVCHNGRCEEPCPPAPIGRIDSMCRCKTP